jgi:hypothetical protein
MKSKEATEKQKAMLPVFHFAVSLKNGLTSAYIGYVRKACNDYLTVIRKALGSDKKEGKEDEVNDKKFGKGGKLNSTNKKWIEEKDDVSIRIGLADYLLIEKHSYASADLLLKTALQAGIKVFETDELPKSYKENKEEWTEDYLDKQMVEFKMNGHSSRKLYNHLKQVINHVYNNDAEKGPEEKKGKFGFGKKEKKFKEKDKKFGNGVKLTDAFYKAVNDKKERLLRIMIADALLYDKGEGPTTKQMLKEIKKAKLDIYGKDDFDKRETDKSKWNKAYLDTVHVKFKGNGSESLYKHVVEVTTYYYKHKEEAKMESFLASIGLLDDDEE